MRDVNDDAVFTLRLGPGLRLDLSPAEGKRGRNYSVTVDSDIFC